MSETLTTTAAVDPFIELATPDRFSELRAVSAARREMIAKHDAYLDSAAAYRDAVATYVASARASGMSQRKAADALGLSETAVRDLLRGDHRRR